VIGDQAYYMGRAAARVAGPQACRFGADTAQGKSWRRGWREVRGADYEPPSVPTPEDEMQSLKARLAALTRRHGLLAAGQYWSAEEDLALILHCRAGLSVKAIHRETGRGTWAIGGRIKRLAALGFEPDMRRDAAAVLARHVAEARAETGLRSAYADGGRRSAVADKRGGVA